SVVRYGGRRRNFWTMFVHWLDGRRNGWSGGAPCLRSFNRATWRVRTGRDGGGVRRNHQDTAYLRDHDLRADPRLHHHRATDDVESHRVLHLAETAENADLRSARPSGRTSSPNSYRRTA